MKKQEQKATNQVPGWRQRAGRAVRFLVFLSLPLIAAAGMLAYGVHGVLLARRFHSPKTLPYAEFARRAPRSGWYRIPDATVDLSAAVPRHVRSNNRGYRENGYYAPVYGPGGAKDGPARLLLCVADAGMPTPGTVARPVAGLIETQLDRSALLGGDVSGLGTALAPGYAVLDDANRPSFGLSLVLALIGAPLTLAYLVAL